MSVSERWSRVEALYHAARARDASERAAFLDGACGGDAELRREVESLLAQPTSGDDFLDEPAVVIAAQMIKKPGAAVLTGRRIGMYLLQTLLGAGGMGEVYRARDTKLGRDVAIKILPSEFTSHPERLARFQREARVLASLNHPNVGAIYGIEDAPCEAGPHVHALVLELVEGQTLAERIARGAVPVAEALAIARQIADALDVAHEKGIIHRDLKPANIKITTDGVVKVLDFGLAKAAADDGSTPDLTQSPTMTIGGTRDGVILGTAAYMSPEQARGAPVDKRTDIWAFGSVLYEMLAGRAAFAGATVADTIAKILEREPDWRMLPTSTPSSVRRLLWRCLEKDAKRRLHDIADARIEVEEALSPPATMKSAEGSTRVIGTAWRLAVAITAVLALGGIAGWSLRLVVSPDARASARVEPAEVRFQITTPPTTDPVSLAISPDGQKLVFVASSEGRSLLWLRSLDAVSARPLMGTDDAALPFWSPDSKALGFFADRQLKRIDLETGTVQALAPAGGGRGGSWNRDGTIVFQPAPGNTPLARVAASGGEVVKLTGLVGRFPQFLPDGRHFIYYGFYGSAASETRGVYLAQLDASTPRHLLDADGAPVYAPSGHLLFVRQGTLVAQPFDAATLELTGDPFPIAGEMAINGPLAVSPLSASGAGPIAYRPGSAAGLRPFVWFDRSGREIERVGEPASNLLSPALSPDGRYVALHRVVDGNADIWLLETRRGVLSRFTTAAAAESSPVWSPDATRLVFESARDVLLKAISGGDTKQLLGANEEVETPNDWSLDGRFLLYEALDPNPSGDLWVLPLRADSKAFPVVQTKFDERDGQFSPDGRWIAYTSDESGQLEVYVQPFPGPGARSQISTGGGGMVRWRRDGKELFYIALDGRLMAVTLRSPSRGQMAPDAGAPIPLFATRIGGPAQANSRQQYMVSADGQHFLMNTFAEENASPITVILNWKAKP